MRMGKAEEEEVRSMEILEVLILSVQLDNSVSGQYMADRRQVETNETFTSIAFLGLHELSWYFVHWDHLNLLDTLCI